MADKPEDLQDERLFDFLRRHIDLGDPSQARLRPFPVNYTSRFWRLETPSRAFVIKIFYPGLEDNPLYPTLPRHEAVALSALEQQGLAPRLETFVTGPTGAPLLVYGYEPSTENEIDVADAAQLVGLLATQEPPDMMTQTVPSGGAEVIAHAEAILAKIPQSRRAVNLRRLKPDPAPGADVPVRRKLVHRSLCLGTLQATRQGPRLIDWQYAGLGDPAEDIAGFLSPGLLTLYGLRPLVLHAEDMFLRHYPDSEIVDRFLRDRPAYHWRLAAYCLYRHETMIHSNAPAARAYGRALEEEVDLLLRLKTK